MWTETMDENIKNKLFDIFSELLVNKKDMEEEIKTIVYSNLWELYDVD
jgi:hypothetical protein